MGAFFESLNPPKQTRDPATGTDLSIKFCLLIIGS